MNFLQKGLAGLESRLDKVLLTEEEQQQQPVAREQKKEAEELNSAGNAARRSVDVKAADARPTTSQPNAIASMSARMSMQERLAAAMARGKIPARSNSPASSLGGGDVPSRTASPVPRTSISSEKGRKWKEPEPQKEAEEIKENGVEKEKEGEKKEEPKTNGKVSTEPTPETDASLAEGAPAPAKATSPEALPEPQTEEPKEPGSAPPNLDLEPESKFIPRASTDSYARPSLDTKPGTPARELHTENGIEDINSSVAELENTISQLREDLILCETRRQDESHAASERIDALEEKIRYLARESAEASRRRATTTTAGGLEKKLAEREEKIALLLEEGEKLSKNELKLQNTIKKLRTKVQEEEKATAEAKRKLEKTEKEAAEAKEKVRRALESEKKAADRVKGLGKIESEFDALRREKENSQGTIAELKERLAEVTRRAEDAESRVQTEALEKEKMVTSELRAQVERVRTEAASVEENLKGEVQDLKAKMERDAERARMMESELKGEQMVMESKMEALRARAEEVSSGAAGDAHAKLLRQVETLQTQYAIASENWKGIEGTLLSRVSSLERERDDLAKKESDIRKKAREMNLKSKTLEMDLDTATSKLKDLEYDVGTQTTTIDSLRKRISELESELLESKRSFEKERQSWKVELQTKLEEERAKWEESRASSRPSSPNPSHPAPSMRKTSGPLSITESFFLGYGRKSPARSPSVEPPREENAGRSKRFSDAGFNTPPMRQDSALSMPQLSAIASSRTASLPGPIEEDDYFDQTASPSSPQRGPDIVSVSTIGAGPSVQLVERMSAAVRRLETEMAGSREEIARMMAQRDEARKEIVELMREVEVKREAETRVKELEEQQRVLEKRMETTLEMLGEKSEEAEELRADVADLKQMYRDLVSATMK